MAQRAQVLSAKQINRIADQAARTAILRGIPKTKHRRFLEQLRQRARTQKGRDLVAERVRELRESDRQEEIQLNISRKIDQTRKEKPFRDWWKRSEKQVRAHIRRRRFDEAIQLLENAEKQAQTTRQFDRMSKEWLSTYNKARLYTRMSQYYQKVSVMLCRAVMCLARSGQVSRAEQLIEKYFGTELTVTTDFLAWHEQNWQNVLKELPKKPGVAQRMLLNASKMAVLPHDFARLSDAWIHVAQRFLGVAPKFVLKREHKEQFLRFCYLQAKQAAEKTSDPRANVLNVCKEASQNQIELVPFSSATPES